MKSAIGFEDTTWNNYEKGKSKPNLDGFIAISNYFGVDEHSLLHIDLSTNVHLIRNDEIRESVHLNVHPNVHLKGKKGTFTGKSQVIDVNHETNTTAINKILQAQEMALEALRDLNSMLSKRVAALEEEGAMLKREIERLKKEVPQIGGGMGSPSVKSA